MTYGQGLIRDMLADTLELLDNVGRRVGMFVYPVTVQSLRNYLHGLEAGCAIGGLVVSREIFIEAAAARGWEFRSTGIVWHMESKGLTEDAIIQELIAVQKEAFRRAAATCEFTS